MDFLIRASLLVANEATKFFQGCCTSGAGSEARPLTDELNILSFQLVECFQCIFYLYIYESTINVRQGLFSFKPQADKTDK